MNTITLGCDPELFLYDENSGSVIPAVGLIGGTKKDPLQISENTWIQEDGVAVEFNTKAFEDYEEFADQVLSSLRECTTFVRQKYRNWSLQAFASWNFAQKDLTSKQATMLGCDPDFLAHERGAKRPIINAATLGTIRCAGGHVHLGYPNMGEGASDKIPAWAAVQFVEAYAYLPYLDMDYQDARRSYYGLAGLYRQKEYGIEYRTPSSFWLSPGIIYDFTERAHKVMEFISNNVTAARGIWERLDLHGIANAITYGRADPMLAQQTREIFSEYI